MKEKKKPGRSRRPPAEENKELRARLEEAEATLRAIRTGEVDALVVSGPLGDQIYTLKSADYSYRILLETLNEGALTLTAEGDILYCNRRFAEMIGRPMEKVITTAIREYVPDDDRPAFDSLFEKGAAEGAGGECRLLCGEKKLLPVYLSVRPIEIDSVKALGVVVMDLQRQKESESAIRRMQKMEALGTLAGGIAHDINNMLSPILVNTELALLETDSKEARENLGIVLEAAQRGRKLVKQILTFAASKEGEKKPVRLASVVEESIRLLRSAIPTTIEIKRDIAATEGMVMGNPTQIEQIILNLSANAAFAMRECGGVLGIGLDEIGVDRSLLAGSRELGSGRYLRLTVSDTGCGMTPEVMERIFDPFFTTKSAAEGAGMGLAVVHGIVKSHDGVIEVESEPGRGSSFVIYFPMIPEAARTLENKVEEMPTGIERIFLIDDEEIQLRSWKPALERLGYMVTVESDGVRALRQFRAQPLRFDLVIADQTMPGITGSHLASEMLRVRPEVPIILCTGFSEQVDEKRALEMGVKAFLMKPFSIHELAKSIRGALSIKAKPHPRS